MSTSGGSSGGGGGGNATQIQGRNVAAAAPNDRDVLAWVAANSDWEPKALTALGALLAANNLADVGAAVTAFDNVSPVTTRGDLIVRGATHNQRLGLGTAYQAVGSDGTDAKWLNKARSLYATGRGSVISSISTAASLIGGPISAVIPANFLAVGDVLHLQFMGYVFNNSGGASTMSIAPAFAGATLTIPAAGTSIASSATSGRLVWGDYRFVVGAIGSGSSGQFDSSYTLYQIGTAASVLLSGAQTALYSANGGSSIIPARLWTGDTTTAISFDVLVLSTVNNAATTGQLMATSLEYLPVA